MIRQRHCLTIQCAAACLVLVCSLCATAQTTGGAASQAVLWTDPGDIRSRNLFWGFGGEKHQPQPPLEFVSEDLHGTSPKFEVRDSDGKKWGAKLGLEAKPEVAVSRLLWAVGYGANENYFFAALHVANMPATLKRGRQLAGRNGDVPNVRLQRHPPGEKKVGQWKWRHNPFYGTRAFNGLRVMMALVANWDLKDDNNAILSNEKEPGPKLYEVSDVGTALGTAGKRYSDADSKGNIRAFERTKLIAHVHKDYVDLNFPSCPPLLSLLQFEWGFYFHQLRIHWIGKHIPRADAKWIGSELAQLSDNQIRDAFRAAGYSPADIEICTHAVLSRIQELNRL